MRKGREISGLPVITLSRGEKVGVVKDLVIDLDRRAVAALLLVESTRQAPARLVPFESISRLGSDAVMVEDESAVVPTSERPQLRALSVSPANVVGLEVFSEEGRLLGVVSDVVVDERSGAIEQYEVSSGPLRDAIGGRSYLLADAPRAIGEKLMIVPEMAVPARRARQDEAPLLLAGVPPWVRLEVTQRDIERAAAELVARQSDLIVGMRAQRTVSNDEPGGVIVYEGETIGEETLEKARAAGKLNLLVEAAGEPAMAALSHGLADQYARLATGRMARRTVRTTEGEVVVSQGDVVTSKMVERAREAGVLDQLMEAVQTPAAEGADAWASRREAAGALWEQIGERVGWLTRRR